MSASRLLHVSNHCLGEICLSDSPDPATAREENVMRARDILPELVKKWPDALPSQSILLLAARLLSAVVRGCASQDFMRFERDPTMENDIVTSYLRHYGVDHCQRLFAEIKTRNLMRTG